MHEVNTDARAVCPPSVTSQPWSVDLVWHSNLRTHVRLVLLGEEPHLLSCVPESAVGSAIRGAVNGPLIADCYRNGPSTGTAVYYGVCMCMQRHDHLH
jgi:hypothetical protein